MKIAVGQMSVTFDKIENLRKIDLMVAQAAQQGAELVVFPEAAMCSSGSSENMLNNVAEPLEGPFVINLQDMAKTYKLAIIAGMFESSVDANRVYNTTVVIDNNGALIEHYRKIHLYDAFGVKESDRFLAGEGSTVVVPIAGMNVGIMICYDLRFPELSRYIAFQGADVIVVPAAWYAGPFKESHLETLSRARAIENNVYVVTSVQQGPMYTGTSTVIDPMGIIQSSATEPEGVLVCEILRSRIDAVREFSPTLQNRRTDLYERWKEVRWYDQATVD